MSFLDELLKQDGTSGPALVEDLTLPDVPTPDAGLRLFNDPSHGLATKDSAGRGRKIRGGSHLYVEDFTPSGFLSTSNFEAALNAAIAAANALPRSTIVHIPTGIWPMTAELVVPGRGYTANAVTLRGEGRNNTILAWPNTYTGVCVNLDGYQGDSAHWSSKFYWMGGLADLSILGDGASGNHDGKATCVLMRSTLGVVLRRVYIGAVGASSNDGISRGVGIRCDGNRTELGLENNQNHSWYDVILAQCTSGLRTRAGMFCGYGLQFNQNRFADVVLEGGNFISIRDGMFQSAGYNADQPNNPYYGNPFYAVRSFGLQVRAGTGAATSAASAGLVTVSSLSGVTTADVGRWIWFTGAPDPRENGIFEIVEYVSATSFKIRKANGVGATGLAYAIHQTDGGDLVEIGGLQYHEGVIEAFARLGRAEATAGYLKLSGIYPHNMNGLLESDGGFRITIKDIPREAPAVFWVKLKRTDGCDIYGAIETPQSHPDKYVLDAFSRENLRVVGGPAPSIGRTIVDILAPMCSEIWDPGDPTTVTITGGYVQQVVGKLQGTVLAAPSSGQRPVWIPAHPRMGGKAALGCRATGNRFMSATLSGAAALAAGSNYGLFVIMHLPTGYTAGGGGARGPGLESVDGSSEWMRITVDAGDSSGSVIAYMKTITAYASPQLSLASLNNRKTVAILAVPRLANAGTDPNTFYPSIVVDSPSNVFAYAGTQSVTAALTKFFLTGFGGGGGADCDIALAAVVKRPTTRAEEAALFRAADAYRLDCAAAVTATRSGAFTTESVADATIPVDLTSVNATTTLPTGRAGDRVTYAIVSAASGHTLTITGTINGGSSLVVSTDYGVVTLENTGTTWFVRSKA
jgi:hypothetical protein